MKLGCAVLAACACVCASMKLDLKTKPATVVRSRRVFALGGAAVALCAPLGASAPVLSSPFWKTAHFVHNAPSSDQQKLGEFAA